MSWSEFFKQAGRSQLLDESGDHWSLEANRIWVETEMSRSGSEYFFLNKLEVANC